jgi:hypothetical protein
MFRAKIFFKIVGTKPILAINSIYMMKVKILTHLKSLVSFSICRFLENEKAKFTILDYATLPPS